MKIKLFLTSLLFAFSLQAAAETSRHLVLLNGKAKNFDAQVAELGGTVVFRHGPTNFAVVDGLDEADVSELSQLDYVGQIEENFTVQLPNTEIDAAETVAADAIESPSDPASAFFWAYQWNMRAIDADDAWAAGRTGSSDVTVAILDTGIAYTHADLAGLVDLERSASFLPQDDALVDAFFPGMHHITDLHYHGTHVAATVASNAYAAAGVTSQTTLMGVKVCSVYGGCPGSAIFQGIIHAVENGADVINMSLGGTFEKSDYPGYVGFLNSFFNYARSQGVTVVVSAGNSAIDLDHDGDGYKTYCNTPATICVSATGPDYQETSRGPWENIDAPSVYSNIGRSAVNVAAPGGNFGREDSPQNAYVRAACSSTSLVIPICRTGTYIVGLLGTSMASPHVSGLAALMVEDFGRDPAQIKTMIQNTADDLGLPGADPAYGKGRINVLNAVQ